MHGCMDWRPRRRAVLARALLLAPALVVPAVFAPLSGCASGSSAATAPRVASEPDAAKAVELRYRAFAQGLSLGLVNESHSDRVALYSERKSAGSATTKVSPDEVVDAIVEYFRSEGFFEIASRGRAPAQPPAGATQVLEVVLPDGAYHALARPGVTQEFAQTFQTCRKALLDVYSETMQLQAVDAPPEWQPGTRTPPRNRGGG